MIVDVAVRADCVETATSVVDSADKVLCSTDVGASSDGETAAVVGSGLCATDVGLDAVEMTTIVVAPADEMLCAVEVGAACVLVSAAIVGCAEVDVAWAKTDAVAMIITAATSASSIS